MTMRHLRSFLCRTKALLQPEPRLGGLATSLKPNILKLPKQELQTIRFLRQFEFYFHAPILTTSPFPLVQA